MYTLYTNILKEIMLHTRNIKKHMKQKWKNLLKTNDSHQKN